MKKLFILFIFLVSCKKIYYFEKYDNNKIEVVIKGKIENPGKYELEIGDTLEKLIMKAGGFLSDADRENYDLKRRMKDNEEIFIQSKMENKININTANHKQLETLDGIGKTLAQRIIEYRNQNGIFKNIDDLKKVRGFSEKKYQKIQEFIKIR